MRIQLSDHFTYKRLLQFVLSPVLMMICTSLYSIVDGFFVSNYVGKTPFAAVNLVMPVCMALGAIGTMIGCCLAGTWRRKKGEGQSIFLYVGVFCGSIKYCVVLNRICLCRANLCSAWSRRRTSSKLCCVQQAFIFCIDTLCATKYFSKFFCYCRKTILKP